MCYYYGARVRPCDSRAILYVVDPAC
eukprot:COSAG01_NODE_62464_length_284_cov_1.113514_1_plen_25_part_10